MGIEIAEKRGITPREYRASIALLDEMDFKVEVREGPLYQIGGCWMHGHVQSIFLGLGGP